MVRGGSDDGGGGGGRSCVNARDFQGGGLIGSWKGKSAPKLHSKSARSRQFNPTYPCLSQQGMNTHALTPTLARLEEEEIVRSIIEGIVQGLVYSSGLNRDLMES